VGMCGSQPIRFDHMHKKWRIGEKKIIKKGTEFDRAKRQPTAAGCWPAITDMILKHKLSTGFSP
jgi:hypothetical protein